MDATTLCALMQKAKKVFAKEQTFLSFPVSPLPFAPRQLDFFDQSSPAATAESNRHRAEFSRLVDWVATGEAWQPGGEARLSETYDAVLDGAELAVSARTAEEEAQYQAARAVLRTGDRDSDKLIAYRQRRDAYLLAEERYTALRLTADSASDDEKLAWRQTTEPALRRELAELLQAWMFDGFKDEIDAAQQQIAMLGARSPALTWSEWRSRCNPDLDALHDPQDNSVVMPSGFLPANAVADDAWRGFTLTPAEVTALLQEAPAALLTAMLGSASPVAGTQAIAFEFSSAAVLRPWFDAGVFRARFWRFAAADRMLSDGKSPATGECPAYVAAVVFARKVVVTDTAPRPPTGTPGKFDGFRFAAATQLAHAQVVHPASPATDPDLQPGEVPPHLRARRVGVRATPFAARVALREPVAVSPMLLRATPAAAAFRAVAAPAQPAPAPAPALALSPAARARFDSLRIDRLPNRVVAVAPAPPQPAPPTPPAGPDDTVYVLAFICKPLPRCPDPDPALQWA